MPGYVLDRISSGNVFLHLFKPWISIKELMSAGVEGEQVLVFIGTCKSEEQVGYDLFVQTVRDVALRRGNT